MSLTWSTTGSVPGGTAAGCGVEKKVVRAAHQFEAVLLNSLLGSLEKTLAKAPGESESDSGNDYKYMGTQALATALGDRGALGVANLIIRKLSHCGGQEEFRAGGEITKVQQQVGR